MTVPRPKLPRHHPNYQSEFEEAARPAIHALIALSEAAGWAPETIAAGLRSLVRAYVGDNTAEFESKIETRTSAKVKSVDRTLA